MPIDSEQTNKMNGALVDNFDKLTIGDARKEKYYQLLSQTPTRDHNIAIQNYNLSQ